MAGSIEEPAGDEAKVVLNRFTIAHIESIRQAEIVLTKQRALPEGDRGIRQKNDDARTIRIRADGSHEAGGVETR